MANLDIQPPAWHGTGIHTYSAARDRRVIQTVLEDREGIVGAGDFAITPTSPASMSVRMAAGRAWVHGDAVARQGTYLFEQAAAIDVGPLAPAHLTLNRIDLIVLRDYDAAADGGSAGQDAGVVEIVQGVAAASPSVPAVPASSIPLASVTVLAGATSIASNRITDLRPRATIDGWLGGLGNLRNLLAQDGRQMTMRYGDDQVNWRFRYDAGSSSPYKWALVGGGDLIAEENLLGNRASASYGPLDAGFGPAVSIPGAGIYAVEFGARVDTSAGNPAYVGLEVASTPADDDGAAIGLFSTAWNVTLWRKRRLEVTGAGGAALLSLAYRTGGANATFHDRTIAVRPIRIA